MHNVCNFIFGLILLHEVCKMSLRLLLPTVLVFSLFSCHQNPAGDGPVRLSLNSQTFTPESILDFVNSTRITRENALSSLQAMKASFRESYIGYELKKQLIGKSGDEIFAECERMFNAKFDENPQGLYSHEFIDLNSSCVALFQDSHLSVASQGLQPLVVTGIHRMRKFQNRYYVTSIRPNLLKKFEEIGSLPADSLVNQVKLGDEVLEIDGKDPSKALQDIRLLIGSSSPLANELKATTAFFNRTFSYPKSGKVTVKLKSSSGQSHTIEMPWVQITRGAFDTSASLYDRQIFLLENNRSRNQTETVQGTTTTRTVVTTEENLFKVDFLLTQLEMFNQMSAAKTYFSDNEGENEALTHALVTHNNKTACYLRLDTFNLESADNVAYRVYEKVGENYVQQSATLSIKSFLEGCELNRNKLIIDVRQNPGGNPKYALEIYSMLADQNRTQFSFAKNYLIRSGNTNFLLQLMRDYNAAAPTVSHQLMMLLFQGNHAQSNGISDWIVLRPKSSTTIFNQAVTLLTSSSCVSACDFFAHIIKNTSRGRVVGRATNGTGLGFTSIEANTHMANTEFRDTLNYFKVEIPNMAFSTTSATGANTIEDNSTIGFTLPFADVPIIENRPVQPDVELDFTLKDYTDGYEDYLRVIERFM